MAFEIERKFLVKGDVWRGLAEPLRIRQGYVPTKDGSDSQAKAELGEKWADNAGLKYKYFMVFLKDGDAVQGALKVDAFLNTLEKL